ncbi:hypothetical protein OIU74_014020 [Salix koriyanagi]|uniref:Uncharacterized protein n=1 Tax=Salix koriyanagi TaxID=2511006 RepID=A0A9Q0PUT2_9ROSI|nr:hypothetical protein OIU74_014020 [Salix koriyanagi]
MVSYGLVSMSRSGKVFAEDQLNNTEQQFTKSNTTKEMPLETRQNICRIANAIRVMSILGFNVTLDVILETIDLSSTLNLGIDEMLGARVPCFGSRERS